VSNSSAYLTLANFKSTIEAIVSDDSVPAKKFIWYDDLRLSPDQSAGMVRAFNVRFLERDGALEVEDTATHASEAEWIVEVAFPLQYELLERQRIILNDSRDLIKALRDDRSYVGVCDSRLFLRDSVVDEGQTAYLRQRWRTAIFEVE
jgi:hypothetical protein